MQAEQSVRTLPFALALAKDATIPVHALEIEETLAHMTMAALMHPHHTVDAFHRTTGPHCVSQDGVLAQWLPKHPGIRLGVVLPEERPELWKAYGVRGTPTLVLRSPTGREEVLVGRKSEAELDAALQRTGATSSEPLPSEGREPSQ